LIRHISSAAKRYVERLLDRPMTDTSANPADTVEALFQFGQQNRRELRGFIEAFPSEDREAPREFKLMNSSPAATRKKIVTHALRHEV
jgi:hypothetical protein